MVARYNPCGAPVEIGRRPYRTRVRLYPDTEEEFEIEWYPARDDVPFLRGPHAVNSLQWCDDRDEFLRTDVGELPGATRAYNPERGKPLAIGGHVCGTPEDFAGDGVFDDQPPFVEYRDDGLPKCCGALFEGQGGLVLGGTCDVIVVSGPGPDCASAAPVELDTTYDEVHPGGLVEQWFVCEGLAVPGIYHVSGSAATPSRRIEIRAGASCGDSSLVYAGDMLALCVTAVIGAPTYDKIYVRVGHPVFPQPAGDYSFRVEPGPCP